jgi:hypothetical protein
VVVLPTIEKFLIVQLEEIKQFIKSVRTKKWDYEIFVIGIMTTKRSGSKFYYLVKENPDEFKK